MTNYNERLEEALERLAVAGRGWGVSEDAQIESMISDLAEANQAITSLTKELVAEAKPGKYSSGESILNVDGIGEVDGYEGYNQAIDQFEQNLLKALEEV